MVFHRLFRSFPHRGRGDFEMAERSAPVFHGVRRDSRVQVQLVAGEVAMLDRRQYPRESHVLHVSVGLELQPIEAHGDASCYFSAKSASEEIWNLEALVVDSIAAAAGEPLGMKDLVRKGDVLAGVVPGAFELAAGQLAFSPQVATSPRHTPIPQGFPAIQQVKPATVPETPLRVREAIHFRLRIKMRVPRGEHALLERETIAPQRELRR